MKYYPAFLDLRDRQVLVVGGGEIAQRKVAQLLEAGARVNVVSPTLTTALKRMVLKHAIRYRQAEFEGRDLDDVWLVIVATDDKPVNQRIAHIAEDRRVFCNVVDQTPLCSFLAPAIVERGNVLIAVSTGGSSPALAQRMRREIQSQIGPEYGQLADLMNRWRAFVMEKLPGQQNRAEVFHRMVESDILELLRSGRTEEAEQKTAEILQSFLRS
ncbi:bifunctional precorrin-2 dehydrogenase/sirohydrochlorin ferrochelatase [bacterium]|nr:bifunctional precorrin-2 dehydrogenase/sirohydrochlorin ferrochelatase [bacterium]MCI0604106.1 bifunctional precorrin-2 dehydrogenase/sirohydrochlorin ferrochelatase [bacterium]